MKTLLTISMVLSWMVILKILILFLATCTSFLFLEALAEEKDKREKRYKVSKVWLLMTAFVSWIAMVYLVIYR